MRILAISVLVTSVIGGAVLAMPSAHAQEYPWCAVYGNGHGGRNCGFVDYQQCRGALSGNGGYCEQNPFFKGVDRQVLKVRRPVSR
jgi:hypothetical protein